MEHNQTIPEFTGPAIEEWIQTEHPHAQDVNAIVVGQDFESYAVGFAHMVLTDGRMVSHCYTIHPGQVPVLGQIVDNDLI